MRKLYIILITTLFIIFNFSLGQDKNSFFKDYQMSSKRYITNSDGLIMMKVNIWGNVNNPGSHLVYDGIDLASLLSSVGGPIEGANLKKLRLYRENPDDNKKVIYEIDFDEFIRTGDRSSFVKIKPNDTIIVPQKVSSLLIRQIGTINTIFSLVTIYLQITILAGR
jgi:hypothetical protein